MVVKVTVYKNSKSLLEKSNVLKRVFDKKHLQLQKTRFRKRQNEY